MLQIIFFKVRDIQMLTKPDNFRETNTSCGKTLQKECYHKREQNNKILFKVQDLNF